MLFLAGILLHYSHSQDLNPVMYVCVDAGSALKTRLTRHPYWDLFSCLCGLLSPGSSAPGASRGGVQIPDASATHWRSCPRFPGE